MRCKLGEFVVVVGTTGENLDIIGKILYAGIVLNGKYWDWMVVSVGRRFRNEKGKESLYVVAMDEQLLPLSGKGEDEVKRRGLKIS